MQTLNAGIADFQEHLEVAETRFGAFQVGVGDADLTAFPSGALGVQQTDDVSGAAEEASVLTDGSLVGLDALADTMTSVDRLLYHDHLVLPALRLKCLQLTELLQHTCIQYWRLQPSALLKCLHGTQFLEPVRLIWNHR